MPSSISMEDYQFLCDVAREFNEYVPPERVVRPAAAQSDARGDRPGDDFNRRASWAEVLEPHGWKVESSSGDVTYWTRPGKGRGVSATTGKCTSEIGGDLLYVFSSNADPFEPDRGYSKFSAVAALEYGGDFAAAAKGVAERGYGRQFPQDPAVFVGRAGDPGATPRGFKWASELSAPAKGDDWVWEGYLPRGGIALLSALWKVGKTTLLTHLLRACGAGGEFLGRPLKPSKVLYVTEEGERHWVRRRDSLNLGDHVGFYLQPFATKPAPADWVGFVAQLCQDVQEHGFDLIIFDTLSSLWPVQEENDAGAVNTALMPLQSIAKIGAGVLLIHHLRKSGGGEYTGSRGSGALSSFPDILIELTRFDGSDPKDKKRVLRAKGRYEETPDELVIEMVNGEYRHVPDAPAAVVGPAPVLDGDTDEGMILKVLREAGRPLQTDEIRAALASSGSGVRDAKVSVIINSLYARGLLVMTGQMRSKTNPRRFSFPSQSAPGCHAGMTSRESDGDVIPNISFPPDTQGRNETESDECGEIGQ